MNKLKNALNKAVKDLTAEEKSAIQENWDLLNEDFRAKFANIAPEAKPEVDEGDEGKEGLDEESLKGLISKSTREYVDAKAEAIAKQLVDKFAQGVAEQRAKVIDNGGKRIGNKENDDITRKFLRALIAKDAKTARELGMKAIDTSSDGSGADAGFTIPEPLANEVIRLQSVGYGRARQLFSYNLLSQGNTKRVTALGSTLSVFWTDEGEKKGSSQPTFDLVTLTLKKLTVIVPFTEEILEDSGVDLTGLVAQLIREAVDKEVDLQFFSGDGTVWTGIFKDTSIPTNEMAAGEIGSDLSPEHIIALADNTPLGVDARYAMHRTVLSKIRTLKDGDGRYLFNPLAGDGEFGTINGYPVELIEAAPTYASTLTGVNKPIIMFGDFKRGVAYGEKSDIRLKLLDQATITDVDGETPINLAEQDLLAIRAVQRVGMKVTLPGALHRLVTGDAS
jgi:HK97 family phage major capsid protein